MTKRQHYIPRAAYLRRFSDTSFQDDRKNKLLVFDKRNNRQFSSNVYDIGSENYLYECSMFDTNYVEEFLGIADTISADMFNELVEACEKVRVSNARIQLDEETADSIKFFAMLQLMRTPSRLKESIRLCNGDAEFGKNSFVFQLTGIDDDGNIGPAHYIEEFCKDAVITFSYNETSSPFVLNDDPVYREGTENEPLLFRFALSPKLQLILTNPGHQEYEINARNPEYLRFVNDERIVQIWNRTSYDTADRFLFYPPNSGNILDKDDVHFLLKKE